MANLTGLDSFRRLSHFSTFKTRSLPGLEWMEAVLVKYLLIQFIWNIPILMKISRVLMFFFVAKLSSNSPFVICVLTNIDVKLKGVLKQLCAYSYTT